MFLIIPLGSFVIVKILKEVINSYTETESITKRTQFNFQFISIIVCLSVLR